MADRSVRVRLSANVGGYQSSVQKAAKQTDRLRDKAERFAGRSYEAKAGVDTGKATADVAALEKRLDRYDGSTHTARVRLLGTDHASRNISNLIGLGLTFGPTLVPTLAAASAGMLALGSAGGVAAAGASTAALAFAGVGDALKELNEASIDPTEANLENLQQAMGSLSGSGQDFVRFLFSLKPELQELRAMAQAGLLPGVEAGIRELLGVLPQFQALVRNSSIALGALAREGGQALNSPFWRNFIQFIADQAGPTLQSFGRILGDLATGFAGMTMAFNPLARDMIQGLEDLTSRFARWGATLSANQGFQDFVSYVRQVSPQIMDTFGAIVSAVGELAQAAAPIGPVVLQAVESLADVIARIASIPGVGTALVAAATGLGALNTAIRAYQAIAALKVVQALVAWGKSGPRAAGGLRSAAGGLRALGGAAVVAATFGLPMLSDALNDSTTEIDRFVQATEATAGSTERLQPKIQVLSRELERQERLARNAAGAYTNIFGRSMTRWGSKAHRAKQRAEGLRERIDALKHEHRLNSVRTENSSGKNDRLAGSMRGAKVQAQGLARQLGVLSTKHLDADQAALRFDQSVQSLTEHIRQNGVQYGKNTQKGLQQRQMLLSLVQAGKDEVQTLVDQNASYQKVTKAGGRHRQQLKKVANQLGLTEEETRKLIKRYNLTPEDVRTTFWANTKPAIKKIGALKRYTNEQLSEMKDRVLNIKFTGGMGGMATGGPVVGPGTSTSDSIPARLSRGEHVWTAREVRNAGGHDAVEGMRQQARGFAQGGPVMKDSERVKLIFRAQRSGFAQAFEEMQRRMTAGGGRGMTFARAQDGEPYVWGGTGPTGWDCSGFMGGVMAAIQGRNPYQRYFTTASFSGGRGAAGFVRGMRSPFMIGVAPGSHMAGTLGGVNVESSGSAGVRVGGGARGASHGMFPYQFGLAGVGSKSHAGKANEGILADRGAMLPHGALALNTSGDTEGVLTGAQTRSLQAIAQAVTRPVAPAAHTRGGEMRVTGGRVEIARNSFGQLEGYVRDLVVQEIRDDAEFQKRRA